MDTITDGLIAIIHYTLTDDQGETLATTLDGEPMPYLHGAGNVIRGLERGLTGLKVGESKNIEVSPEDGYGLFDSAKIHTVPRAAFPADVSDYDNGKEFLMGNNENPIHDWGVARIIDIDADTVSVDGNHRLAGKTLHFAVTVQAVRPPTPTEHAHGHAHTVDGIEPF